MRSELRNRAALISYEIARQKVDWGGGEKTHRPPQKRGANHSEMGGTAWGGGGKGV